MPYTRPVTSIAIMALLSLGILVCLIPSPMAEDRVPVGERLQETSEPPETAVPMKHLYLPWIGHQELPVRSQDPSGFYEKEFLNPDLADIVIEGDLAYVAAGPRVVVYDISAPGKALRLGESQMASGPIRHLALGEGLIFAMSRPLFDAEFERAKKPEREPRGLELPAWSIVDVFDLDDPTKPRKRGSLELRDPVDFATDIAAWGKFAYLPVITDRDSLEEYRLLQRHEFAGKCESNDSGDDNPPVGNCGFIVVNATDPDSPRLISREATTSYSFSALALDGRLLLNANGGIRRPDGTEEAGSGLFIFDLKSDGQVRFADFSGHGWTALRPDLIAESHHRVYHGGGRSPLLVTSFDEEDHPYLLGYEGLREDEMESRMRYFESERLRFRGCSSNRCTWFSVLCP